MNCETANEMWVKLESVYEKKSQATINLIPQKFFSSTKEPQDDIVTHVSKLQYVAQQMKELGETVSDNMIITKILILKTSELEKI